MDTPIRQNLEGAVISYSYALIRGMKFLFPVIVLQRERACRRPLFLLHCSVLCRTAGSHCQRSGDNRRNKRAMNILHDEFLMDGK